MRITYLKIENFGPFVKEYIELEDKDIIGIIAEWLANPGKSNRSGKSFLIEAIWYCLTGKSRADKEVELIHAGADAMLVELGLVNRKKEKFKIRRGRTLKGEGLLEADWVTKKKEAQEEINKLIGSTPDEFELTNFFQQGDINKFMDLKPAEKKEYLMDWLKNNHWSVLATKASKDLSDKEKELADAKSKLDALSSEIEDKEQLEKNVKRIKKEIKQQNEKLAELIVKRDKLKKSQAVDVDDVKKLKEEKADIEAELEKAKRAKEKVKSISENIKFAGIAIHKLEKKKRNFKSGSIKKLSESRAKCMKDIERIQELIDTAEEHFCGTCPILNEGCDRIKKDPAKVKGWKRELSELETRLNKINSDIEDAESASEVEDTIKQAQDELSHLQTKLEAAQTLQGDLKRLTAKYEAVRGKIAKALDPELRAKLQKYNDKISQLQSGLDDANNNLGQYQSKIERLNKLQAKVEGLRETISSLERQVGDLRYLVVMFGKNGIPSQEIENAFSEIADEINFVLDQLGTSMQVEFKADRELGQWEDACHECGFRYPKGYKSKQCKECGADRLKKRKDELNLAVNDNGKEQNFKLESGGGKTFVSIAVRIALSRLKQRQNGSEFNVLFLDEIDSALDDVARENVMKLITTTLVRKFGIEQVFWVSHSKKISESVPHTLKVIRHKDYAKTKWV